MLIVAPAVAGSEIMDVGSRPYSRRERQYYSTMRISDDDILILWKFALPLRRKEEAGCCSFVVEFVAVSRRISRVTSAARVGSAVRHPPEMT
ncbi:hypothetical protein AncyloWKF20_20360 [Ancylobacter sp. WKF20]|uniref:hypothetical protein n=1 Tax=Ancylobacter sp. WKF20 TaxID=3039801 RepID=UPI00243444CF|nr:hypothetical protein [Ancylobacter sp. WKF20]WGD30071.1 hypothetical protein AncyloWKF20_20360 [Ancylobacter sp. WKF20]